VLGAGYMRPEALLRMRELTKIDLFIPEKHHASLHQINQMRHWIEQSCLELQTTLN
jgi:hypothetical protein